MWFEAGEFMYDSKNGVKNKPLSPSHVDRRYNFVAFCLLPPMLTINIQ